jgi:hypothetical protein
VQIIVSVISRAVAQTCVRLCQFDNTLGAHGQLAADAVVALWADADLPRDELEAPFIFDGAVVRGLVDTHPLLTCILPQKIVSLCLRAECTSIEALTLWISLGDAANFQFWLLYHCLIFS